MIHVFLPCLFHMLWAMNNKDFSKYKTNVQTFLTKDEEIKNKLLNENLELEVVFAVHQQRNCLQMYQDWKKELLQKCIFFKGNNITTGNPKVVAGLFECVSPMEDIGMDNIENFKIRKGIYHYCPKGFLKIFPQDDNFEKFPLMVTVNKDQYFLAERLSDPKNSESIFDTCYHRTKPRFAYLTVKHEMQKNRMSYIMEHFNANSEIKIGLSLGDCKRQKEANRFMFLQKYKSTKTLKYLLAQESLSVKKADTKKAY